MKVFIKILLIHFLCSQISIAQLTHQFKQVARNMNYGDAHSISLGLDGTIFLANGLGGLRAFKYINHELIQTADLDNNFDARSVAVGPDGTVFLAEGYSGGLSAYFYDELSFIKKAGIEKITVRDIEVSSNGIIFTADYGLISAYFYDGSSFVNVGNIEDDEYETEDLCLYQDSVIFLANGHGGLRAYYYNGSSFTETAYINDGGNTTGVTVGPNGIVYVTKEDGLYAYTYTGSVFTSIAYLSVGIENDPPRDEPIAISPDGMIYIVFDEHPGDDGLHAYSFNNNSFTKVAETRDIVFTDIKIAPDGTLMLASSEGFGVYHRSDSSILKDQEFRNGWALAAKQNTDGTVFVANAFDGLRAYNYDGQSFSSIAYFDSALYWKGCQSPGSGDIEFGSDGTVFFANADGLKAFTFDGDSFLMNASADVGRVISIELAADGTIFLTNDGSGCGGGPPPPPNSIRDNGSGLSAYLFDGDSIINTAYINDPGNAYDIAVHTDGTVFLANGSDGLRAYKYNGSSFEHTAHASIDSGEASLVNISTDNTIFLWAFPNLYLFNFTGDSFIPINHYKIDIYGGVTDIEIGPDNTLYMLVYNGLHAYKYSENSLIKVAENNDYCCESFISLGQDGTIFSSFGREGLIAYTYNPITGIQEKESIISTNFLYQNYPNPFNPVTTISYQLEMTSEVQLSIYNILGQKLATLVNKKQLAGTYNIEWDASIFSSGVYFYRLKTENGNVQTKKLILMK